MLWNGIASDELFKTNECAQIVCKFVYDNHKHYHFPNIFFKHVRNNLQNNLQPPPPQKKNQIKF